MRKDLSIKNSDQDLIEWIVLQRIYSSLSPEGRDRADTDCLEKIKSEEGIDAATDKDLLKIVKTGQGKNRLPKM